MSHANNDTLEENPEIPENQPTERILQVELKLPHEPYKTKLSISTQEQVQDVRQSIIDLPYGMRYSCFHLEHNGIPISDFIDLSEVKDLGEDSVFTLVEDPYTEKEARTHITRIRELINAGGNRNDISTGIQAGASLSENVANAPIDYAAYAATHAKSESLSTDFLVPTIEHSPKTVKSVSLSHWNPPPYHLRNKGHLLYLLMINLEGEQFHITSHVSGFYQNRSSHNKFDPTPKSGPKPVFAHSLLDLLSQIDPKFEAAFEALIEHNSEKDPLTLYQLTNATPASPWIVSPEYHSLVEHKPDITRTQESFLLTGADNSDNLRDWNEEFQSTRELPKTQFAEQVFRERLISKLFADFNDAAVRGAVLVARNEIAPLNPTEGRDAQIFVHNNVFFSFGADGVGTFATEGGDEAARVATGKDVSGVKAVNQLDIPDLFTAATIIVDYMGKRIVGQSIVPGIFKQRDPGDSIDYGGVEGKDIIAEKPEFIEPFASLSKAFHVKKHPVWDKEGKRHDLEASVDTKGLLGTDGRKYVLDLYRLTPLDVTWIEKYWGETSEEKTLDKDYPHRMAVLRPELVESFRITSLIDKVEEARSKLKTIASKTIDDTKELTDEEKAKKEDELQKQKEEELEAQRKVYKDFEFSLNPDVFAGQIPQTNEEKDQMNKDEELVREICKYLTSTVIPRLINQFSDRDITIPSDGISLTTLLHKRGINIRYLGHMASLVDKDEYRLKVISKVIRQEIVSRSFKHVANRYLKGVPHPLASACVAHLLNCLVGSRYNNDPVPETDENIKELYSDGDFSFESLTPEGFQTEIVEEIRKRFRYKFEGPLVSDGRELQMVRDISLKLGLQLVAKDYIFDVTDANNGAETNHSTTNGTNGTKKRKSKKDSSPTREHIPTEYKQTFHAEDIINFFPIIKEASPKSSLAEDAFEAGRNSLATGQRTVGTELLMESLTLHDQIYGILHADVARIYLQLSTIYFSLEEKITAADLARKAVIIHERTLGLDHPETLHAYLNLGVLEGQIDNHDKGARYVLHALSLLRLTYGYGEDEHPDTLPLLTNAAMLLQSLRQPLPALELLSSAKDLATKIHGAQSTNVATLLFQTAQTLALAREVHEAVNVMRIAAAMFKTVLGADDRNTKEAQAWVDSLTQSAVLVAKRKKEAGFIEQQAAELTGKRKGLPVVELSVPVVAAEKKIWKEDKRNIDDLVKFIQGEDKKKGKHAIAAGGQAASSQQSKKKALKRI